MINFPVKLRSSLLFLLVVFMLKSGGLSAAHIEASDPMIGEDASGNLVAIWVCYDTDISVQKWVICARTCQADVWSDTTLISDDTLNSGSPRLAVNDSGHAAVIWISQGATGEYILHGVMFSPTSEEESEELTFGEWINPLQISNGLETVKSYQVKINDNNQVAVIWNTETVANASVVHVLKGTIEGGWNIASVPISNY